MVNGADSNEPADRYDELMARRAALELEAHRRLMDHREEVLRQLPVAGGRSPWAAAWMEFALQVTARWQRR